MNFLKKIPLHFAKHFATPRKDGRYTLGFFFVWLSFSQTHFSVDFLISEASTMFLVFAPFVHFVKNKKKAKENLS
jgi:hypothetical protein